METHACTCKSINKVVCIHQKGHISNWSRLEIKKERFPSLAIIERPKRKTKKALWQHETITLFDYYALAGVDY